MKKLPKTIMKTVRYIRQDAPVEQLEVILQAVTKAINQRKEMVEK